MSKVSVFVTVLLALSAGVFAETITFTLVTHGDNIGLLPQEKGITGRSGDHLLRTADDDITTGTWNPNGCFGFSFMNPYGVWPPDYPDGYVEGIHSMEGTIELDMDLSGGGPVAISSLYLHGQAKYNPSGDKYAYQYLVESGGPAAGGSYGPIDGMGNSGSYAASAESNWAFAANVDWYYDTPCPGPGAIDMTFDDFQWEGFIIPASELTPAGMDAVMLIDPLGFFDGTSEDFESWLVNEVADRLPPAAEHLLFVQEEAKPGWTNPGMQGWDPNYGILGETIIAYAVPEPGSMLLLLTGLWACAAKRAGAAKWPLMTRRRAAGPGRHETRRPPRRAGTAHRRVARR